MIYKVWKDDIKIWDFVNNKEIKVSFKELLPIVRVSLNLSKDKIAILGGSFDPSQQKLFVVDLCNSKIIIELNVFLDFQWFSSNEILYSDGKKIYKLSLNEKKVEELFKFSKIQYAPIKIFVSPNRSKISIVKMYKDHKKISVYHLISSSMTEFKSSIFNYTWLDDDCLIYDCFGGIKILNISNGKSSFLIKNVNELIIKTGSQNEQIKDLFEVIKKGYESNEFFRGGEVASPEYANGRLYLKISVAIDYKKRMGVLNITRHQKRIGVVSTKKDLSDIKFHFYDTKGLIDNYWTTNHPDIVGVNIFPNKLIHEKCEYGLFYFYNNNKLEFKDYNPIT